MDQHIRRLPESLHLHILAHLPLPDICRYRAVSKQWKKALSSSTFLKLHTEVSKSRKIENWIISHYTGSEFWIFYAGDGRWRRVESGKLGTSYGTSAHGGGLLCSLQFHSYRWLVGNPFSGRWKVLSQARHCQALVIVPGPHCSKSKAKPYRILALTNQRLIVYFSELDKWKKRDVPPELRRLTLNNCVSFSGEVVTCAGPYHPWTNDPQPEPMYVWSYHVEKDVWKKLDAGPLPLKLALQKYNLNKYTLVHAGDGSLVLVGACWNSSATNIENGMVVWRLEKGSRDWVEIARAPESMSERLLECRQHKYGGNSSLAFATSSWGNTILCYEFGSSSWRWLDVKPVVPKDEFADEESLRSFLQLTWGFRDDLIVCLEAGDTCADQNLA